ncbi:hypothetical protein FE392_14990, partial [Xenorhabdus sp. 12]
IGHISFTVPLADSINEKTSTLKITPNTLEIGKNLPAELKLVLKDHKDQPISGVQKRIEFVPSGLSGNGDKPEIGDIKEESDKSGIYTATLTAGTQIGTLTVTPKIDEKIFSKLAEKVEFTPPTPPKVSQLKLQVVDQKYLVVGQTLKVDYVLEQNDPNGIDNSFYAWGEKGKTAAAVKELADSGDNGLPGNDGTLVTGEVKDGEGVPPYALKEEHAGKVLEFSILARNGVNARASDIVTLSTDDSKGKGNETESKIGGGRVSNVAQKIKMTWDIEDKSKTVTIDGQLVYKLMAKSDLTKSGTIGRAQLTVTPQNSNDQPVAWVPVMIEMQGYARNGSDAVPQDNVKTMLDGKEGTFSSYTDGTGKLVKTVTDPDGIGLRTKLKAVADGVNGATVEDETNIIFTVLTSPDVPEANYWGHMEKKVKIKGKYYRRPLLDKEFKERRSATPPTKVNNEDWAVSSIQDAEEKCSNLPSQSELQNNIANRQLYNRYGWPVSLPVGFPVWAANGHAINLRTGTDMLKFSPPPSSHLCVVESNKASAN